jgi:hypothetical protein
MAKFVLKNVRLFAGGADLTTVNNQIALAVEAESKETTAFVPSGDVWHEEISGIASSSISGSGQWEAADASKIDDAAWGSFGSATVPISACPATAADAALAYLSRFNETSYQLFGAVGDVAPWSLAGKGTWPIVRGSVLSSPTARTASGFGPAIQLGAVGAGQRLYANLHVFGVSGTSTPTVTALLESSVDNTFATPTTRLTFAAATAIGGQSVRVAGPITDTWWQPKWTITGTNPSFLFAITAGIAV